MLVNIGVIRGCWKSVGEFQIHWCHMCW